MVVMVSILMIRSQLWCYVDADDKEHNGDNRIVSIGRLSRNHTHVIEGEYGILQFINTMIVGYLQPCGYNVVYSKYTLSL